MTRYYRVPTSFWGLAREWDERTRNLGLYLQTCEHRTGEGLFRLPLAYAAEDLRWTVAVVERHMALLGRAGFIKYDSTAQVVLLPNALETQSPSAPKQIEGAIKRLKAVPPTPLLCDLYTHANTHSNALANEMRKAFPTAFETVTSTHSSPLALTHTRSPSPTSEGPA